MVDPQWYPDFGASHHLTPDDRIGNGQVGNGQGVDKPTALYIQ